MFGFQPKTSPRPKSYVEKKTPENLSQDSYRKESERKATMKPKGSCCNHPLAAHMENPGLRDCLFAYRLLRCLYRKVSVYMLCPRFLSPYSQNRVVGFWPAVPGKTRPRQIGLSACTSSSAPNSTGYISQVSRSDLLAQVPFDKRHSKVAS